MPLVFIPAPVFEGEPFAAQIRPEGGQNYGEIVTLPHTFPHT